MSLLELKNVKYSYAIAQEVEILKGISFKVEKGEFVAIVGENGSGKSTLLKCILGLNKPTSGTIKLKARAGYLPQMTDIQNNFPATIEEIVLSGTIIDNPLKIFYTKQDKQKVENVLKELELFDMRYKCFNELSGGQRQRVLIARALCATENLLILDEPVNGLDPKIVGQIYKLLGKLNKEKDITIIMVSHDIDRSLNYATRVIEIEKGEIKKDVPSQDYLEEVDE